VLAGLVRPMGFFRMARPVGIAQNGIDDNGHERSRDVLTQSDIYEAVRTIARQRSKLSFRGPSAARSPE
jgi:hypothetical protein